MYGSQEIQSRLGFKKKTFLGNVNESACRLGLQSVL